MSSLYLSLVYSKETKNFIFSVLVSKYDRLCAQQHALGVLARCRTQRHRREGRAQGQSRPGRSILDRIVVVSKYRRSCYDENVDDDDDDNHRPSRRCFAAPPGAPRHVLRCRSW